MQQARTKHAAAQAAVRQAETDSTILRDSLQQVRDPLVALGAPAVDGSQLLASWTRAHRVGGCASRTSGARHSPAHTPRTNAAQAALRLAEKALIDAQTQAAQARKAETEATASHERVKAALKGLQTRLGELTASLFDAPTDQKRRRNSLRSTSSPPTARTADAAL